MSSFILVTGGYDTTIRFFDATNQWMSHTIQFCDQQVLRLAFSGKGPVFKDAPLFLIVGGSPSVAVYDVTSTNVSPNLFHVHRAHTEAITAVGFEPEYNAFVFSASEDGTLHTWIPELTPTPPINPHFAPLQPSQQQHQLSTHPMAEGAWLQSGVQRFPAVPVKLLNTSSTGAPVAFHDAVYYPPLDLFFTADASGHFKIWDHSTASEKASLLPHPSRRNLQCLELSSDFRVVVMANFDGYVFVYQVEQLLEDAPSCFPVYFHAFESYIPRIKLSVPGTRIVCTTSSGIVKIFRMADIMSRQPHSPSHGAEQQLDTVSPIHEFTGHPGWVWDAAFVEDREDYLFTCSSNQQVMLWCLNDFEQNQEYTGHEKGVVCLAVRERMPPDPILDNFDPPVATENNIHPPAPRQVYYRQRDVDGVQPPPPPAGHTAA